MTGYIQKNDLLKFSTRKFLRKNWGIFYIFHSDNDPYVSLEKAEKIAKNLGIKIIVVKNAGHFNKEIWYLKFDLILEKIKKYI